MYRGTIILILIGLFLLVSCSKENTAERVSPKNNPPLEFTKLSTNSKDDQRTANEAREFVSKFDEVTDVRAIHHDDQLLIAVKVNHFDRFDLKDIEKKLKKSTNNSFQDVNITLSTDKKLFIEIEKLENELQNDSLSKKELSKRINKLRNLLKEET